MREGRFVDPDLLQQYMEENVIEQRRAVRRLESLEARQDGVTVGVSRFSNPPLFWAYLVDRERLVVGHFASRRLSARNLPVNILVRGDASTRNLYAYCESVIESAMAGGES